METKINCPHCKEPIIIEQEDTPAEPPAPNKPNRVPDGNARGRKWAIYCLIAAGLIVSGLILNPANPLSDLAAKLAFALAVAGVGGLSAFSRTNRQEPLGRRRLFKTANYALGIAILIFIGTGAFNAPDAEELELVEERDEFQMKARAASINATETRRRGYLYADEAAILLERSQHYRSMASSVDTLVKLKQDRRASTSVPLTQLAGILVLGGAVARFYLWVTPQSATANPQS